MSHWPGLVFPGLVLGMALAGPGIEDLPGFRNEFPNVATLAELQLQDAARLGESDLTVLLRGEKALQIAASSSDRKLDYSGLPIEESVGILGLEAFVVMNVTIQYD